MHFSFCDRPAGVAYRNPLPRTLKAWSQCCFRSPRRPVRTTDVLGILFLEVIERGALDHRSFEREAIGGRVLPGSYSGGMFWLRLKKFSGS
jgi:hypothetical protein